LFIFALLIFRPTAFLIKEHLFLAIFFQPQSRRNPLLSAIINLEDDFVMGHSFHKQAFSG